MNKSDKLDELRLEVGMIADQVEKRDQFYSGIVNTIGKYLPHEFGIAIYLCQGGVFSHFRSFGEINEKKVVKFGDGMFSICGIRGKVTVHRHKDGTIKSYTPFYSGQHLLGIMYIECRDCHYEITDEDYIFLTEISRFIELKGNRYSNPIDNIEN